MALPNANKIVSLIFGRKSPGQIQSKRYGPLIIDVNVEESHQFKNQITQFPIENNSLISDHVLQEPEMISFTGFITNTPVKYLGGLIDKNITVLGVDLAGSNPGRLIDAFQRLMEYAGYEYPIQEGTKAGKRNLIDSVDIVTGLRSYSDMVLESLTFPKNAEVGETLRFDVVFKKIRKTQVAFGVATTLSQVNETVTPGNASGAKNQAASQTDAAEKQTKETPTSIARAFRDAAKKKLSELFN